MGQTPIIRANEEGKKLLGEVVQVCLQMGRLDARLNGILSGVELIEPPVIPEPAEED
jgi:hypothetical protein